MFDMHGTPLLPQAELERIESYFGELYLSGEIRKVETDRVAVGTISGEGLSLVFQERAPWSIMDETNKAREHKKAQEGHRCGQIAPHGSVERLRCVDARLCLGV